VGVLHDASDMPNEMTIEGTSLVQLFAISSR
jgi:hypothetical protein